MNECKNHQLNHLTMSFTCKAQIRCARMWTFICIKLAGSFWDQNMVLLCNAGCVSGSSDGQQWAVCALSVHPFLCPLLLSAWKQRVIRQRPRAKADVQPESQVCQVYLQDFCTKIETDKVCVFCCFFLIKCTTGDKMFGNPIASKSPKAKNQEKLWYPEFRGSFRVSSKIHSGISDAYYCCRAM